MTLTPIWVVTDAVTGKHFTVLTNEELPNADLKGSYHVKAYFSKEDLIKHVKEVVKYFADEATKFKEIQDRIGCSNTASYEQAIGAFYALLNLESDLKGQP